MNRPFAKICALFLVITLLPAHEARAQGAFLAESPASLPAAKPDFFIPANLGFVEESRLEGRDPQSPLAVVIQTVHGHYETALKVRDLTRYLRDHYGIETLVAEGAGGRLLPENLRFSRDPEENERALDVLARHGEVTGADLALLQGMRRGVGAEKISLYRRSYGLFKSVIGRQEFSASALERQRLTLEREASKIVQPEMREILAGWEKFSSGQSGILPALELLKARAPEVLGVDFETVYAQWDWPQVTRLAVLGRLDRKRHAETWAAEKKRLEASLRQARLDLGFMDFLENRREGISARRTLEDFITRARKTDFQLRDFPQAMILAAVRVLESELDSRLLYEEMERLFDRTAAASARTDEERALIGRTRRLLLAGKLARLEMTPSQWNLRKSYPERLSDFDPELAGILRTGEEFYLSMHGRERAFLQVIQKTLSADAGKKTVFITGGYHAPAVMQGLEAAGIRAVLISPHIEGELDNGMYQKIMMRGATLERALISQSPEVALLMGWPRSTRSAVTRVLKSAGVRSSGWQEPPRDTKLRPYHKTLTSSAAAPSSPSAAYAGSRSELRSKQAVPDDEAAGRLPGLALYEELVAKPRDTRLLVGRDIAHTGALQAVSILKAIQSKRKAYDDAGRTEKDVLIIFATGNTQWLGLTTLAHFMDSWGQWDEPTRKLLESSGVDLSAKPDMAKIAATHLDTIFPQRRSDYYTYANELHHMFDKLGILPEKRRMFYGDVKNGVIEPGADNQLSETEFAKIEASVDREGLRLDDYLSGKLSKRHTQYAYLKAMDDYAKNLSRYVVETGPDIALFSAGPSYEGKGHIAFNESGTPFHQAVVMSILSYHAAAGNIKERGGMQYFRTPAGAPRLGGVTLGPREIRAKRPIFITIINGKEKRESVRSLVERRAHPRYPVTALQSGAPGSVVIMENASGSTLRFFTNPWDFRRIPAREWTAEMKARFFIQLSKDTGKPVSTLLPRDFLQLPGSENKEVQANRLANLKTLTRGAQAWRAMRFSAARALGTDRLLQPAEVPGRLGLKAGDKIVHIGPHLDDLSLAAQFLVTELGRKGIVLSSYYTAPGYTAVADDYVLSALETLQGLTPEVLKKLTAESSSEEVFRKNEEKYLRQLISVLKKRKLRYEPENYDTWSGMPKAEQELRAKLLFLRLNLQSPLQGHLESPRKIKAVRTSLAAYIRAKPRWGSSEIGVMQKIKIALRFAEEQTELMSRGVRYSDIYEPFQSSWYALERKGTAKQTDIDKIKEVIRQTNPSMVIVNGEGFMDHGAHSITEMTVKVAIKELHEAGELPPGFRIFYYRGVWDRAEIKGTADQILVALGREELQENLRSFVLNYPSQAPALVPDPSVRKPMYFSDQVVRNAQDTLREWRGLSGKKPKSSQVQGILAFEMIDFSNREAVRDFVREVKKKKSELDRVQDPINRASLSKIIGSAPPYADLSGPQGILLQRTLRAADLPVSALLTDEEIQKTRFMPDSRPKFGELPLVEVSPLDNPSAQGRSITGRIMKKTGKKSSPGSSSGQGRQSYRSELRDVSALAMPRLSGAPEDPSWAVAALIAAGMGDLSWNRAALGDYLMWAARTAEALFPSPSLMRRGLDQQSLIEKNTQPIAIYVHIPGTANTDLLDQVLESAVYLAAVNRRKAHWIVLAADRPADIELIRERLLQLLKREYPGDASLRTALYQRIPVESAQNLARLSAVPKGANAAWLDWSSGATSLEIPGPARERRILANRLPDGSQLRFDSRNRGFAAALLQAALLLLGGEELSGLRRNAEGVYTQAHQGVFAAISRTFAALLSLARSA